MDKQVIFGQFNQIEQKVIKLIEKCKDLEAENRQLKDKVAGLEHDIEQKAALGSEYIDERDLIKSRIDELLAKLEEAEEKG